MKVYTGGGDKGKTSLFSGERVAKHHVRIDAYGDIDELNSLLGAIRSMLPLGEADLARDFEEIQRYLFVAGAWLSTTPDSPATKHLSPLPVSAAKDLEQRIDAISEVLPPLKSFILPGGEAVAAWTHVGRTICRRCERKLTLLIEAEKMQENAQLAAVQVYLNRLSDYLFVAARYLNQVLGREDILWK
ncbi:MAG: cob(I)yrinic acid a,c-diamide adenosyltransferase [Desulfobulbaceae bacterium]|nr:cob(I)yrinic acid a,c-diamide adenosyltransferase [Desulfobulbaceae bacterium]